MHGRILETIRVPHVRIDDALVTNFAHPRECGWLGLVLGVDRCSPEYGSGLPQTRLPVEEHAKYERAARNHPRRRLSQRKLSHFRTKEFGHLRHVVHREACARSGNANRIT